MILLWLAAPIGVAALAMLWATWAGRPRRRRRDDDEAQERLRAALAKPLPAKARGVVAQTLDRPTGVAVRPSQRVGSGPLGRR